VEGATIPFVGIDEVEAAYDAVCHLIAKGHRDIGLIYGECYALGKLRKEGYCKALRDMGPAMLINPFKGTGGPLGGSWAPCAYMIMAAILSEEPK
jgi:DNA-binding LacI/PurR family transcriptional regulator